LGWDLLSAHPAAAPFLSELAMTAAPLTAGFPATTATSMTTIGTGRPPGRHGMLGYQVAIPGSGRLLNALRWDDKVDPLRWQPGSTIFERAVSAGVRALRIAPAALRKSGLSAAAMRGARYIAADTNGALVSRTVSELADEAPALALAYHGDLDSTGHALGAGSDAWQYELAHVDKLAEQLAGALPQLREGVALLGGEPRARHVYCEPGAASDVKAAWSEELGDRAWVVGREQAVADGWFGSVDAQFAARIGDVIAAPCGPWAIVATKAEPRESALIGMHGSLTPADQLVPLLTLAAT